VLRQPAWGRGYLVPGLLVAAAVGGMVALVFWGTVPSPPRPPGTRPPPRAKGPPRAVVFGPPLPTALFPALRTRRLPVAGFKDHFVVIDPDGTSYLEAPAGRTQLVDSTFAKTPDEQVLLAKLLRRLDPSSTQPAAPAEPGSLVILDAGVVGVPRDALITYTDATKLVAMNPDGTATVYYADGRTELRGARTPPGKEK